MKLNRSILLGTIVACSLGAQTGYAAPEKEKAPAPKSGLLSTNRVGERATVIDTPWSDAPGDENTSSPIAGSVSRLNQREWKMVVANNGKDPYSVDVAVEQVNDRGTVVKSDHFTYTLKAGEQTTRNISSGVNVSDARLKLGRWKNLAPKPKEEKPTAGAPATAQEPKK